MKVIVICEFSGVVREAFRALGHEAWSLDLLPSEDNSPYHLQCDYMKPDYSVYDLAICHPPCTHLASSGARWFKYKQQEQVEAVKMVLDLSKLPIPRIAIENPIGVLSTKWRKPDQIIQPWMFGHPETKATCLWLKGLPCLQPTLIVSGRDPRVHWESPGPDRWKRRSRTLTGIAAAMATQWGTTS